MYTMVMMMAMSGSADTATFGGKLFGGNSCHGTTVVACCNPCAAPVATSCGSGGSGFLGFGMKHGHSCQGGSGFLGLRDGLGFRGHSHSTGCTGGVVAVPVAPCGGCSVPAPVAPCGGCDVPVMTAPCGGCDVGGVTITETPAPSMAAPAKEMPKPKEEPKKEMPKAKEAPKTEAGKVEKKGEGI